MGDWYIKGGLLGKYRISADTIMSLGMLLLSPFLILVRWGNKIDI